MKNLLIILLCFVYLESCKKDREESNTNSTYTPYQESNHSKINPTLYPYLFNTGSYWIYKDSASLNLDSIALTGLLRTSVPVPPSNPNQTNLGDLEYFDVTYFSSNISSSYHEQLFSNTISRYLYYGGFVFISSKRINDHLYNAVIADVIDSINVENVVYRNVTKMKVSQDSYINGNFYFYYADSVGVIKKDSLVNDTVVQTWNLLRKNTSIYDYQ